LLAWRRRWIEWLSGLSPSSGGWALMLHMIDGDCCICCVLRAREAEKVVVNCGWLADPECAGRPLGFTEISLNVHWNSLWLAESAMKSTARKIKKISKQEIRRQSKATCRTTVWDCTAITRTKKANQPSQHPSKLKASKSRCMHDCEASKHIGPQPHQSDS
jgi:hypothetical protein